MALESVWVGISVAAAALQTARNALQRKLTGYLSPIAATSTRFVYGLPFAILYFAALIAAGIDIPSPGPAFFAWCVLGAVAQILAMQALILLLQLRNFTVGIAYTKTELVQIALVSAVVLGDPLTIGAAAAILVATVGVVLLSAKEGLSARTLALGWTERPALLGLAVGAGYTVTALAIRGATLSLGASATFLSAGALALVTMLCMQTILLVGWIAWREPKQLMRVAASWRASALPGLTGAAASAGWMTAMAIEPAAHVRMVGLLEVVFSYAVTVLWFREQPTMRELLATGLIVGGILLLLVSVG